MNLLLQKITLGLLFNNDIFFIICITFELFIVFLQIKTIKEKKLINFRIIFVINTILILFFFVFKYIIFYIYSTTFVYQEISLFIVFLINLLIFIIRNPRNIPEINLLKPDIKKYRGKIHLGTIFHDKKILKPLNLNIEDIKRHIIIYGQTGTGKTVFLKNFLINFSKQYKNISFILFEFKGEYSCLTDSIKNLNIIKPGTNFSFNIFNNDIFSKEIYVEILFDSLKSCQIIENNADFSPQMEKVLVDVLKLICNEKKNNLGIFFFIC